MKFYSVKISLIEQYSVPPDLYSKNLRNLLNDRILVHKEHAETVRDNYAPGLDLENNIDIDVLDNPTHETLVSSGFHQTNLVVF